MKLNPDLIRDILLTVEDATSLHEWFYYPKSYSRLDVYNEDEALYHLRQCELSGFFIIPNMDLGDTFAIKDLSPLGHKFIENIRAEKNWIETKSIAKRVGSFSLNILEDIATKVIIEMVSKQTGIN